MWTKKLRTIIEAIIFTLLFVTTTSAEPETLQELGIKGIELAHDMQFDEADKIFDEMIRMEPENAFGYLLKLSSFNLMAEIKGIEKEQGEYLKDLTLKTINIAEGMLEKNEDDIDALFYLGCAYGNLGVYYTDTGSWLSAYWNGRKGKNCLEKAVEKDPEYYDAYLGLGMYHYYADVLPKVVKPLSFLLGIEGNRAKGIEEITLAITKGRFAKGSAKYFLAKSVYLREEDYETALPLFKELTMDYPHSHSLLMKLAICYLNLKKYDLSVQIMENSLQSEFPDGHEYLRSQLYYNLGRAYSELKEYYEAISALKEACEISRSKEGDKSWVYARSLFSIGYSYEMMGSMDKAREYYSQIGEKDGESVYKNAQARIKKSLLPATQGTE